MSSTNKPSAKSTGSRRSLHVVIDKELDALISTAVANDVVSTSAIVRDALRAYFKVDDPRGRGWREGYVAGIADVRRRLREVLVDEARSNDLTALETPASG
jgi:hypothetical protein